MQEPAPAAAAGTPAPLPGPTADPLAVRLERRAGRALKRALGLPPAAALRLRSVPARRPRSRPRRSYIVDAGERDLGMLHALHSRRSMLARREVSGILRRSGVPAPALLWSDGSRIRRVWRGGYLVLEEYLQGTPLAEAGDWRAPLGELGEILSRLHANRRARWGRLRGGRHRGFGRHRLRQVRALLRQLRRAGAISGREARDLHGRFARWRGRLDRLSEFDLIHDDLHAGNVLVGPRGSPRLIDLRRVRYDRRERDLACAITHLCRAEDEASRRFLERYERGPGGQGDAALIVFETAALCLRHWGIHAARAARLEPGRERSAQQAASETWASRAMGQVGRLEHPGPG